MTSDRQLWLFTRGFTTLPKSSAISESGRRMSELNEELWAVLSERGVEASALSYQQAADAMRSLMREKVSGLSVITVDAARRVAPTANTQTRQLNSNGARKVRRNG